MTPVFYSFRRCPYAMRARLALLVSHTRTELREVVLREKPEAFLIASPTASVPCLVTADEGVIDESLDIMKWALARNDPQGWLDMPTEADSWIARCDGPFKHALDRTKYASRYPAEDTRQHRDEASAFLSDLDRALDGWLFGTPCLADWAMVPFVRQFALIDKPWFDAQPWPNLQKWLSRALSDPAFDKIMHKYPQWHPHDPPVYFPA